MANHCCNVSAVGLHISHIADNNPNNIVAYNNPNNIVADNNPNNIVANNNPNNIVADNNPKTKPPTTSTRPVAKIQPAQQQNTRTVPNSTPKT